MKTGVYKILNLQTSDCYIGSCSHKKGFNLRWSNHLRSLRKGIHHSIILQRAWEKFGEINFKLEVVETCLPEQCIQREQHYLDTIKPKYNVLKVAGSCLGRKLSAEHIQKLKNRSYEWMKGENNWNKSSEKREFYRQQLLNTPMKINDEGRKKISAFHKGNPKSESHKKRISETLIGVAKSPEHKEKIKLWAKTYNSGKDSYFHDHKFAFNGEKNGNFSGYYRFKNLLTNENITTSKIDLANIYSLDHTKVCAICNGTRKSTKKWICLEKNKNYVTKI